MFKDKIKVARAVKCVSLIQVTMMLAVAKMKIYRLIKLSWNNNRMIKRVILGLVLKFSKSNVKIWLKQKSKSKKRKRLKSMLLQDITNRIQLLLKKSQESKMQDYREIIAHQLESLSKSKQQSQKSLTSLQTQAPRKTLSFSSQTTW